MTDDRSPEHELVTEITEAMDHIGTAMVWAAETRNYQDYTDGLEAANDELMAVVEQVAADEFDMSPEELRALARDEEE